MIERCLQTMFDEGPGEGTAHGHYTNMVSTKYSGVACSFHAQPDGSLWVVQNFYP
jgi:Cysteine-rich secretory protein family